MNNRDVDSLFTLVQKILRCVCQEENALLHASPSRINIVISNPEVARKLLEYGENMLRMGNALCIEAVDNLPEQESNKIRKATAYLLFEQFRTVAEHVYGRYPDLLPDYLKDGDVDGFISHCRAEAKEISFDAFKNIMDWALRLESEITVLASSSWEKKGGAYEYIK